MTLTDSRSVLKAEIRSLSPVSRHPARLSTPGHVGHDCHVVTSRPGRPPKTPTPPRVLFFFYSGKEKKGSIVGGAAMFSARVPHRRRDFHSAGCSLINQSSKDQKLSFENQTDRCTCTHGGLQRRFFSGAGAKLSDGLFFNTMTTPSDSALSLSTRCFNCQPTWTNHSGKSVSPPMAKREEMTLQTSRGQQSAGWGGARASYRLLSSYVAASIRPDLQDHTDPAGLRVGLSPVNQTVAPPP